MIPIPGFPLFDVGECVQSRLPDPRPRVFPERLQRLPEFGVAEIPGTRTEREAGWFLPRLFQFRPRLDMAGPLPHQLRFEPLGPGRQGVVGLLEGGGEASPGLFDILWPR